MSDAAAPHSPYDDALTRVRALCAALPDVAERPSHGAPTFFVKGKRSFVMFWDDHHGDGRLALWCAAPPESQPALRAEAPDWFFVPPYVGPRGWIGLRLDRGLDWETIAELVVEAYCAVAPPKLAEAAAARLPSFHRDKEVVMLSAPAREYLLAALDNTPVTVAALTGHLAPDAPEWDVRPYKDRFTLREIVAHLADWEEVWRDRYERTVAEETPAIARPNPDERAAARRYDKADPRQSMILLRARRTANAGWLRRLPDEAWERTAFLERMGGLTLGCLPALALAHDAYHLRQIAEWLAGSGPRPSSDE